MDFYFPDSQDQINPMFDFITEERSPYHVRQRDDRYPHEVHSKPPYTGILVSKAIIDGVGGAGKYTVAQRHRLYRLGVRGFFRLDEAPGVPATDDGRLWSILLRGAAHPAVQRGRGARLL